MPLAAIPGVEHIGEAVVNEDADAADARQAQHAPEPGVARRAQPDRDGAIGADMEPAIRIDAMEAATDVLDPGAEAGIRSRRRAPRARDDFSASRCRCYRPGIWCCTKP
jgi:hypothetical protein